MMSLLKRRVEQLNLMQTELAENAGISNTLMSYILNGKRDISYIFAERVYKDLGYNSPISVIFNYYNFEADPDIDENLTEGEVLTETIGNLIITHFKKHDLNREEKEEFLNSLLSIAELLVEKLVKELKKEKEQKTIKRR